MENSSSGGVQIADSSVVHVSTDVYMDKNLVNDGGGVRCCGKPIKVGEQWLLCGKKKSRFPFHCMVGPDWPMVVLVYTLIISINSVVLGLASSCLGWPVLLVGLAGCCILLTAYTTVACTDPGIVYKDLDEHEEEQLQLLQLRQQEEEQRKQQQLQLQQQQTGQEGDGGAATDLALLPINQGITPSSSSSDINAPILKKPASSKQRVEMVNGVPCKTTIECGQCNLQRPYSARHCVYCGVCVEDLDHHCPWCGKCIGESNMFAFSAFVGMLCFQGYLLAGIFIYWIVTCFVVAGPHGPGFKRD